MTAYFLPRAIHPFAWWGWAIALAVAAGGTTNPLLLAGIVGVACLVTFSRRGDNPWARGFVIYLVLGAVVVVMRVAFRILFGGGDGPTVLVDLPEIPLPWWVAGIRLLGPISLESVLTGFYDGARLATMIICLGAANSLANPKKLLASLPSALHELGTILVVAIGVFPQLGDSVLRVTRARRLRRAAAAGRGRRERYRVVESVIVPVLSDALDRSLRLAASMDARGYGRRGEGQPRERRWTTALGLAGITLLGLGVFLHLSRLATGAVVAGVPLVSAGLVALGVVLIALSVRRAGRGVRRTVYRPIRWALAEWVVVGSGLGLVVALEATRTLGGASVLAPSIQPFTWPTWTPLIVLGLVAAALPAFGTPAPALAAAREPAHQEALS